MEKETHSFVMLVLTILLIGGISLILDRVLSWKTSPTESSPLLPSEAEEADY